MIKALALTAASAAALLVSAGAAQARWVKAETERFIVYGDVPEATARDYAVKLTTYDKVLHTYAPKADDSPPPRKFEVFLVGRGGLQRVMPGMSQDVGGFYLSSSQAEFAVASLAAAGLDGDTVLFHEYAHHFMFANFPAAYPGWFIEGWAEYFGNTRITPDRIKIGAYNDNRVSWLNAAEWIRWDDLFGKRPRELRFSEEPLYYPQAWLFIHYMMSNQERAEQLNKIIADVAAGQDPVKAVHAATHMNGIQLDREIRNYTSLQLLTLKNPGSKAAVTVTALPPSADDLLLDKLRLQTDDMGKPEPDFLASVRRRAAKYPGDALAEQVLALAEFTHGDVAAGEAIVARRLAAAPDEVETLRIAGVGQILAGERDPAAKLARYRAARPFLIKAYGLDKSDFRTLYAYAFSRTVEPGFPNDNDLNALREAQGLAPSAPDIALVTGDALMRRGDAAGAKRILTILANGPHGGETAVRAQKLLAGGAPLALDSLRLIGGDTDEPPKKPPAGKAASGG